MKAKIFQPNVKQAKLKTKNAVDQPINPKQGDAIKFAYAKYDAVKQKTVQVVAIGQIANTSDKGCFIVNNAVQYPSCQPIKFRWGGIVVQQNQIIAIV